MRINVHDNKDAMLLLLLLPVAAVAAAVAVFAKVRK